MAVAAMRCRAYLAGLVMVLGCILHSAPAQKPAGEPAVFLSDLHLDPFRDPGKVEKLAAVPYTQWRAILSSPDTPGRQEANARLDKVCQAQNADTSYALLASGLKAAHDLSPRARFVTVTGDLIAHNFGCHFETLLPGRPGREYRAFVEKTIRFVASELQRNFPGMPIYAVLGNNDSDCGDYRADLESTFLRDLAPMMVDELAMQKGASRASALASFAARGAYSVLLPGAVQHTRLIAISNTYLSDKYAACSGKPNPDAGAKQIAWLRAQIAEARTKQQQVWVIGHIPPGIDLYSTILHGKAVCEGQAPETFLANTDLDDALRSGAGVIRVALFAHTHMDEIHLLSAANAADGIAIKQVGSISPNNGNMPTMTTALVDPSSGVLLDYTVYRASNRTGVQTTWAKEYDFAESYHLPAFTAATLSELTSKFFADRTGKAPESQSYLRNYFSDDLGKQLALVWPAYVCTFTHTSPKDFSDCMCNAAKK